MIKQGGSSVGAFLKASRSANVTAEDLLTEAPRAAPSGVAPVPVESMPVRDTAGEILKLLDTGPLPPAEIWRRMGLSATEALSVLERLEHFGFVEIAAEGRQKLVKLAGS